MFLLGRSGGGGVFEIAVLETGRGRLTGVTLIPPAHLSSTSPTSRPASAPTSEDFPTLVYPTTATTGLPERRRPARCTPRVRRTCVLGRGQAPFSPIFALFRSIFFYAERWAAPYPPSITPSVA
jgi:hypothetical protein